MDPATIRPADPLGALNGARSPQRSGSGALDRTHAASVGRHSAPPGDGGVSGPLLGITAARCSGSRTDVNSGTETGGCSILKSMYAYPLRV